MFLNAFFCWGGTQIRNFVDCYIRRRSILWFAILIVWITILEGKCTRLIFYWTRTGNKRGYIFLWNAVSMDFHMRNCTLTPNPFNFLIILIILLFFLIPIDVIDKIILRISNICVDWVMLVVVQGWLNSLRLSLIMMIESYTRNTDRSCISMIALWIFIFIQLMLPILTMRTMR